MSRHSATLDDRRLMSLYCPLIMSLCGNVWQQVAGLSEIEVSSTTEVTPPATPPPTPRLRPLSPRTLTMSLDLGL